jgi:hypothetical protein
MQQADLPDSPGPSGESKRRIFPFKRGDGFADARVDAVLTASHHMMMDRLEQGLRTIEGAASGLMREIAEEVWEAGGEATSDTGTPRIIEALSRDQTIRSLIAHSDERYQNLDLRIARIEEGLSDVNDAARGLREVLDRDDRPIVRIPQASDGTEEVPAPDILDELGTLDAGLPGREAEVVTRLERIEGGIAAANSATEDLRAQLRMDKDVRYDRLFDRLIDVEENLETIHRTTADFDSHLDTALAGLRQELQASDIPSEVRERLETVQEFLVSAIQYQWERDRALVDWLYQTATAGTQTVQVEAAAVREDVGRAERTLVDTMRSELASVGARVDEHARVLGEAIVTIETRALAAMDGQTDGDRDVMERLESVREAAQAATTTVAELVGDRVAELNERVRSTAEELRIELAAKATAADIEPVRHIDQRLSRLGDLVSSAMTTANERLDETIKRETFRAVNAGMADAMAVMDRRFTELDESVRRWMVDVGASAANGNGKGTAKGKAPSAAGALALTDRIDRMDRKIEAAFGALEEAVAERTSEVVHEALAARGNGLGTAPVPRIPEMDGEVTARVARAVNERVAALARMIRSDNETLMRRMEILEQQAAAKETTRAVNELAAALPDEVGEAMDRRLRVLAELFRKENRSTADLLARTAGALAERLDRTAATIGERFDREVETVVTDTVQNLAMGLQRAGVTRNRTA